VRYRDRCIHDQRDAERDRDRPWDRSRRLDHLLAERRNTRVTREREEQEPGGLQDPYALAP
jgi:hypothetical protein